MSGFQPEWWHWMVLGLILSLAELAIPSFFIIWFGMGALLVGVVLLVFPTLAPTAQLVSFIVCSVAMTVLWFRVLRNQPHKSRVGMADDGVVIGETGLLVAAVAPFQRGSVRFQRPLLGSDLWPCIADEEIAAGERVRVVAVEGSYLKVVSKTPGTPAA